MRVVRRYTVEGRDPFSSFVFAPRTSRIANPDGSVVFEMKDVMVPEHFSQVAVDILAQKYFRRAGLPRVGVRVAEEGVPAWLQRTVPAEGDPRDERERDSRQVFRRLAGCWTYWGWKGGYFSSEGDALAYHDEMCHMLAAQMAAPNSPQWFNTGLHWAYGIDGPAQGHYRVDPATGEMRRSTSAYEHPSPHACFIQSVNDDLVNDGGIMDLWVREARIFKYGSGTGSSFSSLRGAGEPLSGGGKSSGLMSFLKIGDRAAGAIKSGGTCLAPHTMVYTAKGPVPVRDLAEKGEDFVALSYDPPAGRYKAKTARAWFAGRKRVVHVVTDKGWFDLTFDHPVRLSNHETCLAGDLETGQSLLACAIGRQHGHLRVSLRDGMKGKQFFHRLVAHDVMGHDLEGKVVHHIDGDVDNNVPGNLAVMTQAEHAGLHARETVEAGRHAFRLQQFAKAGEANGMSGTGRFWADEAKAEKYREANCAELLERGDAPEMEDDAATQKMLNTGFELMNAGCDISTFAGYVAARKKHIGRIASIRGLARKFDERFGGYPAYLKALAEENHRVLWVEDAGTMDVYDVEVDCPTADDKTRTSGHNFVIWPDGRATGSGVVVYNTRRAAKMVVLDLDHPDIEEFINWKVVEEDKVAALVTGSKTLNVRLNAILKAILGWPKADERFDRKRNLDLKKAIAEARAALVPANYVERVAQLAQQGFTSLKIEEYDTDWDSKAYYTVSGQNSNNSVRISNDFMDAVIKDGPWNLYWRTEKEKAQATGRLPKARRTLPARDLWNQISYAAWACADPGVQFDTTINEWHTCPAGGRINASNPCSEYMFIDDTACNLASLNLLRFFDQGRNRFDVDSYRHATRLWTITLEASVFMAQFPSVPVAQKSYDYRTLGLGYANIGSLLMVQGIPYDSPEGRAQCAAFTSIMHAVSYATSAEMAGEVGPFPHYEANREAMLRVIRNHRRAAYDAPKGDYEGLTIAPVGIDERVCPAYLLEAARKDNDRMLELGEKHGFRNAQVTVVAPTGCLVGGSLVTTSRGLVPLATLGDVNGEQWQDAAFRVQTDQGPKQATKFYINGVAPTRRLTTANGYAIQGTLQHRVKVVDAAIGEWQWKRFSDIAPGDVVPLAMSGLVGDPVPVNLPPLGEEYWTCDYTTTVPRRMTPDLAELVGYFMGDGSLHGKGLRFCVSKEDPDVVERLRFLGKSLFNLEAAIEPRQGYVEVAFNSVSLTMWWEGCGFIKLAPHPDHSGKGWVPRIPLSVLYTNDRAVYGAFLRGLFEADGTVSGAVPAWCSAHASFSKQVKTLLLTMGFPTSSKIDMPGWGSAPVTVLRLKNESYNDAYLAELGFLGARKRSAVVRYASHPQAAREGSRPPGGGRAGARAVLGGGQRRQSPWLSSGMAWSAAVRSRRCTRPPATGRWARRWATSTTRWRATRTAASS